MKKSLVLLNVALACSLLAGGCGSPKSVERVVTATADSREEQVSEVAVIAEPGVEVPTSPATQDLHACDVIPDLSAVRTWWQEWGEDSEAWDSPEPPFSVEELNDGVVVSNCAAFFEAPAAAEDLRVRAFFENGSVQEFDRGAQPLSALGFVAAVYKFAEPQAVSEMWHALGEQDLDLGDWIDWACSEELQWIDPGSCENFAWTEARLLGDIDDVGTMQISIAGGYDAAPERMELPGPEGREATTASVAHFWDRWMLVTTVYDVDRYAAGDEISSERVEEVASYFADRQLERVQSTPTAGAVRNAVSLPPRTPEISRTIGPAPELGQDRTAASEEPDHMSITPGWPNAASGHPGLLRLAQAQQTTEDVQIVLNQLHVVDDRDDAFLGIENAGDVYAVSSVELLGQSSKETKANQWPSVAGETVDIHSGETMREVNFVVWRSDESSSYLERDFRASMEIRVYDEDSGTFLGTLAKLWKDISWEGLPAPIAKLQKASKVIQQAGTVWSLARSTGPTEIDRFVCNPCPVKALTGGGYWAPGGQARGQVSEPLFRYSYDAVDTVVWGMSSAARRHLLFFSEMNLAAEDTLVVMGTSTFGPNSIVYVRDAEPAGQWLPTIVDGNGVTLLVSGSSDASEREGKGFTLMRVLPLFEEAGRGANGCGESGIGACFQFNLIREP